MQDLSKDSINRKGLRTTEASRKRRLRWWAFGLGLSVLVIFAGQRLAASETADPNQPQTTDRQKELSGQLEELIRQLRQERSAYYARKAQYESQIEKARENRRVLQDELDDLRRQEAESDQQFQKYEAEVNDLKEQLAAKASLESVVHEQVQPFLVSQRAAIEGGIPYKQQERIARLEAAGADPNAPSGSSAADQLEHVWNYAQEELRLARSSETYSARAKTQDESSPYARFFRVGQKILGYVTEDGRQAAMWSSLARHKDWLFVTDAKQASQIRNAVEILDRRQEPKLVTLPIPLQPKASDEGDADASP
jgi:chromosome segregation ATPase